MVYTFSALRVTGACRQSAVLARRRLNILLPLNFTAETVGKCAAPRCASVTRCASRNDHYAMFFPAVRNASFATNVATPTRQVPGSFALERAQRPTASSLQARVVSTRSYTGQHWAVSDASWVLAVQSERKTLSRLPASCRGRAASPEERWHTGGAPRIQDALSISHLELCEPRRTQTTSQSPMHWQKERLFSSSSGPRTGSTRQWATTSADWMAAVPAFPRRPIDSSLPAGRRPASHQGHRPPRPRTSSASTPMAVRGQSLRMARSASTPLLARPSTAPGEPANAPA